VICHRCKNLWRPPQQPAQFQETTAPQRGVLDEFNPLPILPDPGQGAVAAAGMSFGNRHQIQRTIARTAWWERHRAKVYFLGFALLCVGLVALSPVNTFIAFVFSNEAVRAGTPLQGLASAQFMLVRGLAAILSIFIPLYCALHVIDALPNSTVRNNIVAVGTVSGGLALLSLFAVIPIWGALAFLVQIAIILYLYDILTGSLGQFLLVYLVVSVIARLLTTVLVGGTYGLLAGLS
jgi:hypothetical protein